MSPAGGAAAAAVLVAPPAPQLLPQGTPPPPPDTGPRDRADLYKAVGVGAAISILAGILDHQVC